MYSLIYEDDDVVVVNKPCHCLSVPGKSAQPNLFEMLQQSYADLRLVHRLDMATSGLIIFARHYQAQMRLNRQFETRQVFKRYTAVVEGWVDSRWEK